MISLVLIFFCHFAFAAPEPFSINGVETGSDFHFIQRDGKYSYIGEAKFRNEVDRVRYRQFMTGAYRSIHSNWRIGAFAQVEQGLRWGSDWKKSNGSWDWQDENKRWDFSVIADLSYRTETPVERLVFEWKQRFYWYPHWDALQWRTRPSLNYFIMKNDRPWWQLNLATEYYLPLSYQQGHLAETWYYSSALWHANKNFKVGPMLAFRQRWFESSKDFENKFQQSWQTKQETLYLGLNFIWVN